MRQRKFAYILMSSLAILGACREGAESVAQNGYCDAYPLVTETPYRLPYAVGKTVIVGQGNCSAVSHFADSRFAYDMTMEIGSEILAIRAGRAVEIVENYADGNGCPNVNFLVIEHDDGTAAQYMHLTKNGALIEINEKVEQGQVVALSGNTGCSGGPHLHLALLLNPNARRTLPLTFSNVLPQHRQLQAGTTYVSLPPTN